MGQVRSDPLLYQSGGVASQKSVELSQGGRRVLKGLPRVPEDCWGDLPKPRPLPVFLEISKAGLVGCRRTQTGAASWLLPCPALFPSSWQRSAVCWPCFLTYLYYVYISCQKHRPYFVVLTAQVSVCHKTIEKLQNKVNNGTF